MKVLTRSLAVSIVLCVASSTTQAQRTSYVQVVKPAPLAETLTPSINGSGVELSANLSGRMLAPPTGSVVFTITTANAVVMTSPPIPVAANTAAWLFASGPGAFTASAAYSGDNNYQPENAFTGLTVSQSLASDFDFLLPTVTVKQGQSWAGKVQVLPLNGFTGVISFACGTTPTMMTCSFAQPASVTVTPALAGQTQPLPLNIGTVPTTVTPSSMTFLAIISLILLFGVRRRSRKALSILPLCLLAGCGTGQRYVQQDGTPPGTYTIPVTGQSGPLSHMKQLTVIVTK